MREELRGLLLCGAALLAAACGASRPAAQASQAPPARVLTDPVAYLPPEAPLFGRVDVSRWRGSPLWQWLSALARRVPAAPGADPDFAPLEETDAFFFAVAPRAGGVGPEDSSVVGVLRGRFGPGFLAARAAARGLAPAREGSQVYLHRDTWWMQPRDDLLVGCSADRVDWVLRRAQPVQAPPPTVRDGALYASLASRVDFERAALAVFARDVEGRGAGRLRESRAALGPFGPFLDEIKHFAVRAEPEAGLRVLGTADLESPARAQELSQLTQRSLSRWADNHLLAAMGLRELLTGVKVSADGAFVSAEAALDERALDRWLRRLGPALEQALAAGGVGTSAVATGAPPPAPPPAPAQQAATAP